MKKRTLLLSFAVAAVAVAAAFAWLTIRRGFSARDNPSAMEAYVARTARKLSIPAQERDAQKPFAPSPELLSEARAHFADHCANCHGNDGSGKTEIGQNLYPKVPDMRQPETQNLTDGEIYSIIHNGIRLTGIPAWGAPGTDNDSWKLVVFIRHLPQMNPEEMKEMERFNPKSANDRSEEEDEQRFLNQGKTPKRKMHHLQGRTRMKQMILLLAMVLFTVGTTLAHGQEQHVMGTVTALTENSITVRTKAKDLITVYTMPDTKYEKSGRTRSITDLKVGDRVVIHAAKMNDKLMATEVRFGSAAHAQYKP